MAAATPKDPITCHVLDTTTGRPAAGIKVVLSVINSPQYGVDWVSSFSGTTDGDGRILNWTLKGPDGIAQPAFKAIKKWTPDVEDKADASEESKAWSLTFDTSAYYGTGVAFFHEVELKFKVKAGEHYHVPLLLGPYSYTTYRGS